MQDADYYNMRVDRMAQLMPRHEAVVKLSVPFIQGKSVLDLGCGAGITSHLMAVAGANRVVGIDSASALIAYAKERWQDENLEFFTLPIGSVEIPLAFDVVTLFDVVEHLSRDEFMKMFSVIDRHTHGGSVVLINYPYPPYLDWVRRNHPGELQPTDNSVMLEELLAGLGEYSLTHMSTYGVDRGMLEYSFLVFKNKKVIIP